MIIWSSYTSFSPNVLQIDVICLSSFCFVFLFMVCSFSILLSTLPSIYFSHSTSLLTFFFIRPTPHKQQPILPKSSIINQPTTFIQPPAAQFSTSILPIPFPSLNSTSSQHQLPPLIQLHLLACWKKKISEKYGDKKDFHSVLLATISHDDDR